MGLFDKEESVAPVVAEPIKPTAPKAEVKSAPVADTTDYWANAWANRGV
jgi:hypothetical protein